MRIIAVNHVSMPDRLEALPDGWEVWSTDAPSPITYRDIAREAIEEGWGLETIVVQDDVRFTVSPLPTPQADLVVYGQTGSNHICQRALAAAPVGWLELGERWDGLYQPCRAWQPMVHRVGIVLDVTTHLEPVGSRGTHQGVLA